MKRTLYLLLIALLAISCGGKKGGASTITFDSIEVHKEIKLLPDKPDSLPYAKLDIKFIYPKKFGSKEQLQKLQFIFYEKVFGKKYAETNTPDVIVENYVKDYIKVYRDIIPHFDEALLQFGEEARSFPTFSFSLSVFNKIEYESANVLSFSACSDDYQGGAHGIYFRDNVAVNLNTVEKIQEKDIFIEDYKEPLALVIREQLLEYIRDDRDEDSDAETLKQYFFQFDSIYSNNNFLMDDKGLHYVYNVYEIAPYASGMFELFIPYSKIANLLKPDVFAELFPEINLQEMASELQAITEEPQQDPTYNDFPVAYVRDGKLYFFNPESDTKMEFTEEKDSVFNCVYSDRDAMLYYTVSRNGKLMIKQVDLSTTPTQPDLLFNLDKPTSEFYTETYGEKSKLKFIKGNLLLECDFVWEYYSFTKYYDYSIKNNTIAKIDWDKFGSKYKDYLYNLESSTKNYKSVYNKAKRLDFSKYLEGTYDKSIEKECHFEGASADDSKIVFAMMLDMCDLAHGPYCVANADGTDIQILDNTDMGSSFKPLWCNNNVVYLCSYNSETEKNEWGGAKRIIELCYTRATDNSIAHIDQDVDYYAVRTKHPIK